MKQIPYRLSDNFAILVRDQTIFREHIIIVEDDCHITSTIKMFLYKMHDIQYNNKLLLNYFRVNVEYSALLCLHSLQ
jgi:hypothetical protein